MASIINASTAGVGGVITTADNSGNLNIQSGGTTVVAVTSAGVAVTGVGTFKNASMTNPVSLTGSSVNTTYGMLTFNNVDTNTGALGIWGGADNDLRFNTPTGGSHIFRTNNVTNMTLNSSGNLGVGTATPSYTGHFVNSVNAASASFGIIASAATTANQYGAFVQLAGDPNNTTNYALKFNGASTERATIRSNGGLANFSANNANLSDERTKKDIVDAGNYLDKICAIPVRTFLYKDQTDDELNLGVIAQEVEAVAPELVDLSGFGETPEDGVPLKAIYQTDLQYALMKSIQELKAIVDTQAEQIKALQGAK